MMFSSWCIQVLLNRIILALHYLTWVCLRLLALILVAYLSIARLHMNLEYLTLSLLESLILSFIVFNVHFICVTGASWSTCLLVTGSLCWSCPSLTTLQWRDPPESCSALENIALSSILHFFCLFYRMYCGHLLR